MKTISWKYVKPLKNQNAVVDLEQKLNVQFPADLKSVIEQHNNGRPEFKLFDTATRKECVFKKLLSLNEEDLENIYDYLDMETEIQGLIPFANDPFGNLICLYQNKIVFWDHETDKMELITDTFSQFIDSLYSEE